MKNIFDISSNDTEIVKLTYVILLILGLSFSLFLIFQGISDPFGEFLIISGVLSLILVPLLLKIIFALIFSKISHDKSKH